MIVDIKGVGQAQFPDDMPIADIRSFLRNKYYDRAAQGQSDILSPQPQIASPYEPTLTERLGGGIAEGLKGAGLISDNYGAQQIGKNVTALGEFLPGIGDAAAGDEFGRAVAEGDNLGMGLAALGAIPVAGDAAKQALRKVKSVDLPSGKLGSDQFKIIKQSDPKAKTKTNPDGTVNVTYLEEYQPKQLKGPLHEFDPDALELSEGTFKNTDTYKGDKDSPITVTKQDGDYVILDGHHRAKLAKQDGRNVKAVVLPIEDVAEMKQDNIHQADMRKEWIARGNYKPEETSQSLPMDEVRKLSYKEKAKVASEWKTGQPIKLSFARNKESSKNYPSGMDLGQKLEPSGRYMNVDFDDSGFNKNIPNWEFGEIEFKNPLVLEHKSTNSTGWKKDLSEMFGGSTGKRLTSKIKKAGHDGIITKDADGFNETISIR